MTAYQVPVTLGSGSSPSGLVVDTRVYAPVADLSPALSADSGAENMVHMTVVKDFQIPSAVSVRILQLAFLPGPPRRVSLTFSSAPQITCEIQASPDLAAGNGTALGQLTTISAQTVVTLVPAGNSTGEFLDPQLGSGGRRFYRIVAP